MITNLLTAMLALAQSPLIWCFGLVFLLAIVCLICDKPRGSR